MAAYKLAHINVQGQDMILVPLTQDFEYKSGQDQHRFMGYMQECAASAGLRGTVVLVWDVSGGRSKFLGPRQWHGFLASIDMGFVWSNINRELRCR